MLLGSFGKIANPTEMLLIDASVWVASVDPDDRFFQPARAVVRDYERQVAALDLTLYEVANALGPRRRRQDLASHLCHLIPKRCQKVRAVDPVLALAAIDVALEHGLSAYDAAYVAAARLNGWTLVSVDVADLVSRELAVLPEDA